MIVLRQLIGALSLLLVGIVFVLGDLLLWIAAPLMWLAPRTREPILRVVVRLLRDLTAASVRLAGARLEVQPRYADRGGILVVANHQSLLDIVVSFLCVPDGYPQMVAHHRYMRGIPLVSHMMRAYSHIPVFPGRTGRAELDRLGELARAARHPIVIYPEGHRTRDGAIRPWKRAGLQAFLSARPWTVHVVVLDGLWRTARIPDFIRNVSAVRCRVEEAASFEYDGTARDDHDEFIDTLERTMCDKLARMRREDSTRGDRTRAAAGPAVST